MPNNGTRILAEVKFSTSQFEVKYTSHKTTAHSAPKCHIQKDKSLTFSPFLAPPLSLSPFGWPRPLSAGLASREGLLLGPPAGLRPPLSPPRSRSGRLFGAADGRPTDGV